MANLYFTFDGPVGSGSTFRNAQGQFTSAYNKLRPLYGALAEELQYEVAGIISAERSKREKNPLKDPKGTLAEVTKNSQNKEVTNAGFAVGSHNFLSRSAAKYYRIIEEGSAVAAPAYSSTMIDVAQTKTGRKIWLPRGGAFGTQYPIPATDAEADSPRHDIAPLHAYERAWHDINASGRLRQLWRQILVDAGWVNVRGPIPKTFNLGSGGNINY